MRRFSSYTLVIFMAMVFSPYLAAISVVAKEYTFASISGLVEQEVGRIILPKVYHKLGMTITITPMPGKRAEIEAATGKVDGEIMRIWSYGEENPTTIRVPTPYYSLETTAFVKKESGITIENKEELADYSLVKVRGVKHTNNITKDLVDVQDVENTGQMMRFLRVGRADVALTNTMDGQQELKKMASTDIVALPNSLATLNLYHYLHKDHKELVPRIDAVIKEMINSGEMNSLIERAEQSVKALP